MVVALACLTTAVGLVSSCSAYFTGLSKGRISYPVMVFLLCLFSGVVSNFGINEIIAIATPILSVVYPPTLVLIVLALGEGPAPALLDPPHGGAGGPGREPAGGDWHLYRPGDDLPGPPAPGRPWLWMGAPGGDMRPCGGYLSRRRRP